jgi:hypothetical protein
VCLRMVVFGRYYAIPSMRMYVRSEGCSACCVMLHVPFTSNKYTSNQRHTKHKMYKILIEDIYTCYRYT